MSSTEVSPARTFPIAAFPQAFTHLALIDSVLRVIRDGEPGAHAGQPCARPRGRQTDDRAFTQLTIVGERIT